MIHKISHKFGLTIHHISDTHQNHNGLVIPNGIDVLIHSGDSTNYHEPYRNNQEWNDFLAWYEQVPVPNKIYVPGNHDATCFLEEKRVRKDCELHGIEYLNKESVIIEDVHFYGDPITPVFGNWYFTTSRDKLHKHWQMIPEEIDVLITHGPRKGMLDLSYHGKDLEYCGDVSLGKRIDTLPNLLLHCHGHIHDSNGVTNVGVREHNGVFYSNASAVKDGKIGNGIHYQGNTFNI